MKKNKQNKIKKNFFIFTLVFILAIIFLLVIQNKDYQDNDSAKTIEIIKSVEKEKREKTNNKDNIPDNLEDLEIGKITTETTLFESLKENKQILNSLYNFSKPELIKRATVDNTFPSLKDVTDEFILINSYNGNIYLYNQKLNEYIAISEKGKFPIIKDNNKEIVFIKENFNNKSSIFTYNFKSYQFELNQHLSSEKNNFTYLDEANDLIFFKTKENDDLNYFPTNINENPNYSNFYLVNMGKFSKVQSLGSDLITFSEEKNSFYKFKPNETPKKWFGLPETEHTKLVDFSFNNENNWFALLSLAEDFPTLENGRVLYVNGNNISNDFEYILKVDWLDNNHIFVLELTYSAENLYLYNLENNNKVLLDNSLEDFIVDEENQILYYIEGLHKDSKKIFKSHYYKND